MYLVLSLDYQIFCNGSGDIRCDMIEPADQLLSLCNRYVPEESDVAPFMLPGEK